MEKTFIDVLRLITPLSKLHKSKLQSLSKYLDQKQIKDIKYLLKTKKVGIVTSGTGISKELSTHTSYTKIQVVFDDAQIKTFSNDINNILKEKMLHDSYHSFAKKASEKLIKYVAPNILGLSEIKETALLLLFAKERLHVLLIGDPGTGKTDIIRSIERLAPISSFGLGSGTSGAGLSVVMKAGGKLEKGLLPLANNGVCCIDELNLMQKKDRASLYSAMEKGFVTYDKGGSHKKVSAKVRIIATANPVGDKFVGKSLSILKQQIPFDAALLSRFHIVHVIREPDAHKLSIIAKKIVGNSSVKLRKEDIEYIKGYIEYALGKDVKFNKKYADIIADFIEEIKINENKYVIEIGPRIVHGIMRLSQARARISLREETSEEDIKEAIRLVKDSLYVEGIIRP